MLIDCSHAVPSTDYILLRLGCCYRNFKTSHTYVSRIERDREREGRFFVGFPFNNPCASRSPSLVYDCARSVQAACERACEHVYTRYQDLIKLL